MANGDRKVPKERMKNMKNSEIGTQESDNTTSKVSKKCKDDPKSKGESRRPKGGKSL